MIDETFSHPYIWTFSENVSHFLFGRQFKSVNFFSGTLGIVYMYIYTGCPKNNGTVNFQDFALINSYLFSPCWIEHLFLFIITPRSFNLVKKFLFYEYFLMDCHFRALPLRFHWWVALKIWNSRFFLGLCSDQQLSFFTCLDRASFPHYNNTKIIKFGWKLFILWVISYGLSFSGWAINLSSCLETQEIGQIPKMTVHKKLLIK